MIRLEHITVRVPGFAVPDLNLEVGTGEFFVLLGPTGSGKTLILEAIAGLGRVDKGRILVDGRDVTRKAPEKRRIGVVYQDGALFPHLSVEKNITYGRRYHNLSPRIDERLGEVVDLLALEPLLKRSVRNLSGGEKQRVALARALAVEPSVLLLDEPLSALDPAFREEVRRALKELHRTLGLTFFMVTHDFSEALFLADRAAVLSKGKVEQCGPVQEVFRSPETPFVARFVGMKNLFPIEDCETGRRVGPFVLPPCEDPGSPPVRHGLAGVRPEDLTVLAPGEQNGRAYVWPGRVLEFDIGGFHCRMDIEVEGFRLTAAASMDKVFELGLQPGAEVLVHLPPERWRIL